MFQGKLLGEENRTKQGKKLDRDGDQEKSTFSLIPQAALEYELHQQFFHLSVRELLLLLSPPRSIISYGPP